jgi:hypothetical protein
MTTDLFETVIICLKIDLDVGKVAPESMEWIEVACNVVEL